MDCRAGWLDIIIFTVLTERLVFRISSLCFVEDLGLDTKKAQP
ncbi:hypothetical protein SynBIOSE41_03676 [Synechococcus sp. BIOS-E4-1]|nr:hypothetical protein SynBIOSE41_03676 [Synechococcus sp. BIOS-E4-1]